MEAASTDEEGAEKFKVEFAELMEEEGCLPQLMSSVDETGLSWKMPRRTYITKDEITLPGHKSVKDRLTLLLGCNASGDFKLKPMLVCHYESPRVFKQQNIIRSELGVLWKSNHKAWVTRQLFYEWASEAL